MKPNSNQHHQHNNAQTTANIYPEHQTDSLQTFKGNLAELQMEQNGMVMSTPRSISETLAATSSFYPSANASMQVGGSNNNPNNIAFLLGRNSTSSFFNTPTSNSMSSLLPEMNIPKNNNDSYSATSSSPPNSQQPHFLPNNRHSPVFSQFAPMLSSEQTQQHQQPTQNLAQQIASLTFMQQPTHSNATGHITLDGETPIAGTNKQPNFTPNEQRNLGEPKNNNYYVTQLAKLQETDPNAQLLHSSNLLSRMNMDPSNTSNVSSSFSTSRMPMNQTTVNATSQLSPTSFSRAQQTNTTASAPISATTFPQQKPIVEQQSSPQQFFASSQNSLLNDAQFKQHQHQFNNNNANFGKYPVSSLLSSYTPPLPPPSSAASSTLPAAGASSGAFIPGNVNTTSNSMLPPPSSKIEGMSFTTPQDFKTRLRPPSVGTPEVSSQIASQLAPQQQQQQQMRTTTSVFPASAMRHDVSNVSPAFASTYTGSSNPQTYQTMSRFYGPLDPAASVADVQMGDFNVSSFPLAAPLYRNNNFSALQQPSAQDSSPLGIGATASTSLYPAGGNNVVQMYDDPRYLNSNSPKFGGVFKPVSMTSPNDNILRPIPKRAQHEENLHGSYRAGELEGHVGGSSSASAHQQPYPPNSSTTGYFGPMYSNRGDATSAASSSSSMNGTGGRFPNSCTIDPHKRRDSFGSEPSSSASSSISSSSRTPSDDGSSSSSSANSSRRIGAYTAEERRHKIAKYREKKKRAFKFIRYKNRSIMAQQRPRVKGRFVKVAKGDSPSSSSDAKRFSFRGSKLLLSLPMNGLRKGWMFLW